MDISNVFLLVQAETHLMDANFKFSAYKPLPAMDERIQLEASDGSDLPTPRLEP